MKKPTAIGPRLARGHTTLQLVRFLDPNHCVPANRKHSSPQERAFPLIAIRYWHQRRKRKNAMAIPQRASVVITTRSRKDDLRTALQSAVRQTARPEIIVIDDGSTDETAKMVQSEFPQVRLIHHDDSRGLIVRRNEGARLAVGEVVFSIDDDAAFTSAYTVEQTLREFDDPCIGAVAIPYVEPNKGELVFQQAPAGSDVWITDSFVGTSHAVRRDIFLQLGGYRELLIHQGEERDFCARMLSSGRLVRLGRADVIHHYESPKRDMRRMDYYGRRNDVLFVWHIVPMPYFPVHMVGTTFNGVRSAWRARRAANMLGGVLSGYADCLSQWNARSPVPVAVYRLHRKLKKSGPFSIEDIRGQLPPLMQLPDILSTKISFP